VTKTQEKINKQDKEYKNLIEETIESYNNNGKKTIVYFCDTYYPIIDGVIKVLDNYATLMSKHFNIVVVVPKHKNKVIVPNKNYLVIGVSGMFFKFVNYDLAFPELDKYLKRTLKKLRIDLIHSHSPFNMGSFAAKMAKKRNVPLVMTMHSRYKMDFSKYTKNEAILKALISGIVKVFNKSTEVWTMHEGVANELKSYGYKGNINYVPNATDFKIPDNKQELREKINQKYNLTESDNVFLFVGRLVNQKNIQFIADALDLLNKKNLNFKMFFVGDGPDELELKEHIKELNLEDKVILTGKITDKNDLYAYYERSDLFLFPSLYDTSSLVQIEAAAFNTPGVFIEGSVTSSGIIGEHNGFLSENNIDSFANKVFEVINNKEKLKYVAETANKELFITWEELAKKIKARYEYLIENNNK